MIINSELVIFVGVIIQLLGEATYIKDTLKGKTKPNRVTWLIWSLAPLIATIAAVSDGVGWEVVPVFMAGFGPLLVFFASFLNKQAYWKLERLDYACGFFSLLALVLWAITKDPTVTILLSIASDLLAGIPTLVKLWKYPETETITTYFTSLIGSLTSFAVIRVWSFSSYAFPIFLVIVHICQIGAYYRKRIKSIFSSL